MVGRNGKNGRGSIQSCEDCNVYGEVFLRWNSLFLPEGSTAWLCERCWEERKVYFRRNGAPKPLPQFSWRKPSMRSVSEF